MKTGFRIAFIVITPLLFIGCATTQDPNRKILEDAIREGKPRRPTYVPTAVTITGAIKK